MDIKKLVNSMTLEEKTSLCSGLDFWHTKPVERVGIPKMMMSDGPHGLRKQDDKADHLGINDSITAVCFPTAVGLAASFDRNLVYKLGETLGNEAAAENLGVVLGPAINIKRSPLCGRNFEYMSEDPYLAGQLAESYINGVQSKNVGVSVKHFAANNQETRRMTVSAEMDERTLREIYLPAFENAVKKCKPWTIMCSYNKINGVYSSENKWLMEDVLRGEWGFDGFVMTDWGALNDRVTGLKAGIELEMPSSGGKNDRKIVEAVKDGSLDVSVLDRACERVLNVVYKNLENKVKAKFDREADHKIARSLADETIVLLKNDGILPLNKSKRYAFIGGFAKTPRYQGGGSSHINSYKPIGCFAAAADIDKIYADGYGDKDVIDQAKINEAISAAKQADVAIIFAGLPDSFESEGFDRSHMDMPKCHNALIEAVAAANPNTVVVLHNGSPVTMPWIDNVKGVVEAYLGGEAVGEATYDILFGDVNPSAKLAETFPLSLESNPSAKFFPGNQLTVEYRESIFVGYRYYDTAKADVLFPFGHGLSYTSFEYGNLKLDKEQMKHSDTLTVSFTVKNTGKVGGKEIAQVYVASPSGKVFKAEKQLKGFEKVWLDAGETKEISVVLDKRSFAFYNVDAAAWQVESGEYGILVGASSRDIRLEGKITVSGDAKNLKNRIEELPSYYSGKVGDVSEKEFVALLGRELPPVELPEGYKMTMENNFYDCRKTKWGNRIFKLMNRFIKDNQLGNKDGTIAMVMQTPFRAMANMSGGAMSDKMALGLLRVINRDKPLKGWGALIGGLLGTPSRMKRARKNLL